MFYSLPKFPWGLEPLSCYQLPPVVTCTFTLPSLSLFPSLSCFPIPSSVFTGITSQINSSHLNLALGQPLREPKLTQDTHHPLTSLSICPRLCLQGEMVVNTQDSKRKPIEGGLCVYSEPKETGHVPTFLCVDDLVLQGSRSG